MKISSILESSRQFELLENLNAIKDKEIVAVLKAQIEKYGCTFTVDGKHGKLKYPNGKSVTCPRTPSDVRAAKNFARDVRHFEWENGLVDHDSGPKNEQRAATDKKPAPRPSK